MSKVKIGRPRNAQLFYSNNKVVGIHTETVVEVYEADPTAGIATMRSYIRDAKKRIGPDGKYTPSQEYLDHIKKFK
jgi:hypothetical protein